MPLRESGANSSTSSIDCPDLQSQLVLLCQKLKMLSGSGSQVLLSLQLPELLTFAHFHLSLIISFTLPDLADARWQKPHKILPSSPGLSLQSHHGCSKCCTQTHSATWILCQLLHLCWSCLNLS